MLSNGFLPPPGMARRGLKQNPFGGPMYFDEPPGPGPAVGAAAAAAAAPAPPPGLDLESAEVLSAASTAAAARGARSAPPGRVVKLLTAPGRAAAIACPTVAYPHAGSAANSTVRVELVPATAAAAAANGTSVDAADDGRGAALLALTFPFFDTLLYDPVVTFGGPEGMADVPDADAGCVSGAGGGCGALPLEFRGGNGARAARGGGAAAVAAVALAAVAALLAM